MIIPRDDLLKIIGNPTKFSILKKALEGESFSIEDIAEELEISEQEAFRHLDDLNEYDILNKNMTFSTPMNIKRIEEKTHPQLINVYSANEELPHSIKEKLRSIVSIIDSMYTA